MRCDNCGASSFDVKGGAAIHEDSTHIWSSDLGKATVKVTIMIRCNRCRQMYGGQLLSRAAIPFKKLERAPFPTSVIAQCREEFSAGWVLRHQGCDSAWSELAPAASAGWTAANDWARDKKGRPPVRLGWKEVVNAYLETEPAWDYMKVLVTQQAFKD